MRIKYERKKRYNFTFRLHSMGAFVLFDAVPLLFCRFLPCRSILKRDLEEGVNTLFAWKNEPSLMAQSQNKNAERRATSSFRLFLLEARSCFHHHHHVDCYER
jgi:hypothetical protein